MSEMSCVAVDLGASNGRVVVVDCQADHLTLREVRRFDTPRKVDQHTGYQCWDLDGIESEVLTGLGGACTVADPESVGVDGWGVDYVLLDAARRPVAPAVSYRDERTDGVMEQVFTRIPAHEVSGYSV